jgi:hypothetical protein
VGYKDAPLDLTARILRSGMELTPLVAAALHYLCFNIDQAARLGVKE